MPQQVVGLVGFWPDHFIADQTFLPDSLAVFLSLEIVAISNACSSHNQVRIYTKSYTLLLKSHALMHSF